VPSRAPTPRAPGPTLSRPVAPDRTLTQSPWVGRAPAGPQVMATLRNLAIGLLRLAGRTQIAPTLRWVNRDPARTLAFLGLP
jgi:hypothetical protein